MDQANCDLACGLVSASYIAQGAQALAARRRMVKALLSSRRLPQRGWDEATIEMLLQDAALMDSNNFPSNVGVGEREARVACPLVARRHFRLAHGVGRSGDISAEQPKAAGSSLLAKLGAALAGDALEVAGLQGFASPVVLPLATGMALTLTLLAAAGERGAGARHVVWSRIDQKTCLKAIAAANLVPEVVELRRDGDQLATDVAGIEAAVAWLGPAAVAAVVTTTSCFAPRAGDDVVAVAKLCARLGVPHVINNAYGVQSRAVCAQIAAASRRGRVDAVVQSTDKNFMVPVGGALVASPAAPAPPRAPRADGWAPEAAAAAPGEPREPEAAGSGAPVAAAGTGAAPAAPRAAPAAPPLALAERVARAYPGRACASPLIDLLITLLHWGADGWRRELDARERLHGYLIARLKVVADEIGERVLEAPGNPISVALTLDGLARGGGGGGGDKGGGGGDGGGDACDGSRPTDGSSGGGGNSTSGGGVSNGGGNSGGGGATYFGAMLWSRGVSGTRVVAPGKRQEVAGIVFQDYGSHCAGGYPHTYLTAAAALGASEGEVDEFCGRLVRAYREFGRKGAARAGGGGGAAAGGGGAAAGGGGAAAAGEPAAGS